ncbi:MAG: DUF4974 domain-containing protein [Pedobacter sp.]|nr:MAG: DUF4974 domain-containing protein [Pedobacter sp.]
MDKEQNKEEQAAKYRLHYFHRKDIPQLTAQELEEESALVYNKLMQVTQQTPKVKRMWLPAAAAAAVLILAAAVFLYYPSQKEVIPVKTEHAVVNDALPGKHTATLKLANGNSILLSEAIDGKIAEQSGVTISKTKDNLLVYKTNNNNPNPAEYNTISTTNGQEYSVILPDGSRIWLNAASSIKYPATFAATKERIVELSGEAYFEIAKDAAHPFIVKTIGQEIKVLGTHFNVNSYADEAVTKTTLVEGSVQISCVNKVMLKPGQQAVSNKNVVKVSKANVAETVAWKNGDFIFDNESLPSILRQVARWYDVEIIDQANHKDIHLTGTVSRAKKLSTVLNSLARISNLKFDIKDQKVTVSD